MNQNASLGPALILTIPFIINFEAEQLKYRDFVQFKAQRSQLPQTEIFDFIVVGSGTAGSIVAGRLSENGKFKVLLLETGGPLPASLVVPAVDYTAQTFGSVNYLYNSIPQKNMNNKRFLSEQGKTLGGSHGHNRMLYNRGNPLDYDNWAKILKDSSFKYQNLLRLFKKSEHYRGQFPSDQHGTKGPVFIESKNFTLFDVWLRATKELGLNYGDANGPQKIGMSSAEGTVKDGRRFTTYNGYIEPFEKSRKNLKVLTYSEVTKVHFKNKKATGITYLRHGIKFSASAKKEIILSAGNFGSALLLFKSGVGPKDMLKEAGIKVVKNLPIGESMEDHSGLIIKFRINDPSKTASLYYNLTEESVDKYLNFENEFILSNKLTNMQLLIASSIAKERSQKNWADIQIFDGDGQPGYFSTFNSNDIYINLLVGRPEFEDFSLETFKLNTTAYKNGERDNVKLAVFDSKVLVNPKDYQKLKDGVDFLLSFIKTKAFSELDTQVVPYEKCSQKYKLYSPDYWKCYTYDGKYTFQIWHKCGTCRMGLKGQKYSTVNTKFRIYGLKNIRVVDGSVLPRIINANINAAIMVLAEKASENILKLYN